MVACRLANGTEIHFNNLTGKWKERADAVKDVTTLTEFFIDVLSESYSDFKFLKNWFFKNNFHDCKQSFTIDFGNVKNTWQCPGVLFSAIFDEGGPEMDMDIWKASSDSNFIKIFLTRTFPNLEPHVIDSFLWKMPKDDFLYDETDTWHDIQIAKRFAMYEGGIWLYYLGKTYAPIFAIANLKMLDGDNDMTFFTVIDPNKKDNKTKKDKMPEDVTANIAEQPILKIGLSAIVIACMHVSYSNSL